MNLFMSNIHGWETCISPAMYTFCRGKKFLPLWGLRFPIVLMDISKEHPSHASFHGIVLQAVTITLTIMMALKLYKPEVLVLHFPLSLFSYFSALRLYVSNKL